MYSIIASMLLILNKHVGRESDVSHVHIHMQSYLCAGGLDGGIDLSVLIGLHNGGQSLSFCLSVVYIYIYVAVCAFGSRSNRQCKIQNNKLMDFLRISQFWGVSDKGTNIFVMFKYYKIK